MFCGCHVNSAFRCINIRSIRQIGWIIWIKFMKFFAPNFNQSVKCSSAVLQSFIWSLWMITRSFLTEWKWKKCWTFDIWFKLKNVREKTQQNLTGALLCYTIDSRWCFYHNQFAFVVAPKWPHPVQSACPFWPIVGSTSVTIGCHLVGYRGLYMCWMTYGTSQTIHDDEILFASFDFVRHFQSMWHHIWLMISSMFRCRSTNLKLGRNPMNVMYYADWDSIVCP